MKKLNDVCRPIMGELSENYGFINSLFVFSWDSANDFLIMMNMMNICKSLPDILTVLHSHCYGVINLSLVIIYSRLSL